MKYLLDRLVTIFVLLLTLLLVPTLNVEAKWWIFGKSDAGVSTRYIYLNDLSYDELGEKITIYEESLPQGKIFIRGKGSAGKNRIGAVQISLDGKQNWQKAQVASDGSFLFSFTPEVERSYELYVKVLDTAGKSNDVDASRKELVVSAENVQEQIYRVLDELIKAYMAEDSFAFMRLVSDDFVSGTALLDSAIRQDFTAFDNIQLHYNLNNVTQASGGNLFVAISFSRMVTSSRSGDTFSDNASTEFTFKQENGTPKIYSMKNPLIFGLSDATNVATGAVNTSSNDPILVVDSSGNVSQEPFSEALDIIGGGGTEGTSSDIASGTITLQDAEDITNPLFPTEVVLTNQSYDFNSQSYIGTMSMGYDIYLYLNEISVAGGTGVTDLGYCTWSTQSVPSGPQGMDIMIVGDPGRCWAMSFSDGGSVVLQDNGWSETTAGNIITRTANISFKYLAP